MRISKFKIAMISGCLLLAWLFAPEQQANAIPAFARKYQTACQTCHVIIPKLNSFGEAFRLNGYKIVGAEEVLVKDKPLSLGAEPWKDMFPQAMWPADLPGMPPIAIRLIADMEWGKQEGDVPRWDAQLHGMHILSGGRIGDQFAFYSLLMLQSGRDPLLMQGYLLMNDPLRFAGVPDHLLNVRVGAFDPRHFLSNNSITRVQNNEPLYGFYTPMDLKVQNKLPPSQSPGMPMEMPTMFRLNSTQIGAEANGIIARRFYWAFGLVNGPMPMMSYTDNNTHEDIYVQAKLKLFGRDFLGKFDEDEELSTESKPTGTWVDNSLLLEAFSYWGSWPPLGGDGFHPDDDFHYLGGAARITYENLDLAAGLVWGRHRNPWFTAPAASPEYTSYFVKAEYMVFPWLMGRASYESSNWTEPSVFAPSPVDHQINVGLQKSLDMRRILFGPVFAPRANIHIGLEAELYLEHRGADLAGLRNPNNIWLRFDVAY